MAVLPCCFSGASDGAPEISIAVKVDVPFEELGRVETSMELHAVWFVTTAIKRERKKLMEKNIGEWVSVGELAFKNALDRAIVTYVRDELEGAAVGDVRVTWTSGARNGVHGDPALSRAR